jgi:hypothetical protein
VAHGAGEDQNKSARDNFAFLEYTHTGPSVFEAIAFLSEKSTCVNSPMIDRRFSGTAMLSVFGDRGFC